jgi:hypothetical protein
VLQLPGRYYLDGISIERVAGRGSLRLAHLAVVDEVGRRTTSVALGAAFVSDTRHVVERATTPAVRLLELPAALAARVVPRLRVLPDDDAVLEALGGATRLGIDPLQEVLATAADAEGVVLPLAGRAGRAEVVRTEGARIDVRGEGPGLLVVAAAWDPGWAASVDGRALPVVRVNHAGMGIPIGAGFHRVELRHRARGLSAGLAFAAMAAVGLAIALARSRRPEVDSSPKRVLA